MRVRSIVVVGVLAVVVAGAWLTWSHRSTAPPPPGLAALEQRGIAVGSMPADLSTETPMQRSEADSTDDESTSPAERRGPSTQSAPSPRPWTMSAIVVDFDGHPVADAVVHHVRKASAERAVLGRTDHDGCVVLRLERRNVQIAAAKDGVGTSDSRHLDRRRDAGGEVRFVLDMPVLVRGSIVDADGRPVPGLIVEVNRCGSSTLARRFAADDGPMVLADADGRFEFEGWFGLGYRMSAERDGVSTLPEELFVMNRQPAEVVLRFPGAITISGFVIDADGAPVAGAVVKGRREISSGDVGYEALQGTTDASGAFSLPVKRFARYRLIAEKPGLTTSAPIWLEPSEVRPHVSGTLRLGHTVGIAGVVLHEGGAPFEGVRVIARPQPTVECGMVFPSAEDLFGHVKPVVTGADGTFAFEVHPGTEWSLAAVPVDVPDAARVELRAVRPGRKDVQIRLTQAALAGCLVKGTVRCPDGTHPGAYTVALAHHREGDGARIARDAANIDDVSFTVGPLSLGQVYSVRVHQAGAEAPFAPCIVGPFRAEGPQLVIDCVLPAWADVPVRVVDHLGAPARDVSVVLWSDFAFRMSPPTRVDGQGRALLRRQLPGTSTLQVYGESSQLLKRELQVLPGSNPEVVVGLPAPDAAPPAGR